MPLNLAYTPLVAAWLWQQHAVLMFLFAKQLSSGPHFPNLISHR